MSNIVNFTGVTSLDLDADRVINSAIGELNSVLFIVPCFRRPNAYIALLITSSSSKLRKLR